MLVISKSQERDERRGLGRGMVTAIYGLLFCWIPLLGLLLSSVGYGRIVSRVTVRHKTRRRLYAAAAFLMLVVSTGVLMAECYFYVQNPNLPQELGMRAYTWLTGESQLPGADDSLQAFDEVYAPGVDYDQTGAAGLGLDTSIYGYEGDEVWGYDEEEDFAYSDEYEAYTGG